MTVAQTSMVGTTFILVGLTVVVIVAATILNAVEVVSEDEPKAVFVFGEFESVLEPGLNFVPPFVSTVKPIPSGVRTVEALLEGIETVDGTRCSMAVRADVRIVDAGAAFTEVDDYESAFVDVLESVARNEVRAHDAETLRRDAHRLGRRIRDDVADLVDDWGLAVSAVELAVRDQSEVPGVAT